MAKISALTAAAAALGSQELPVNEAGTSKKVTVDQMATFAFVAGAFAPGTFTVATGHFAVMSGGLVLTGVQRATVSGTGRLRIT